MEEMSRAGNFTLVPSDRDIADEPSRTLADIDCSLSQGACTRVQVRFGPHTFALMSLDGNCHRDKEGRLLPHYSPWLTPQSSAVNVFAQLIPVEHNI